MYSKNIILLILAFHSILSFAQRPDADIIKTNKGNLLIQPILHGTLVFQFNGKTIYIDPYGGINAFLGMNSPDYIIITDIHGDHLDINTLKFLNTNSSKFIVPKEVAKKLDREFHKNLQIISNGESLDQNDFSIKALPMYNLPEDPNSFHTKGRGNGYLITFGDKSIYISGDTEDIKEMRELKNIDIAFICMNLPYTMEIDIAADAVLEFQPKIVYPYHYRGKPEISDINAFKNLVNDKNPNIEVRLRNWYPKYK